ncbi:hypothetical protein QE411_002430 [Microbacterium arborescens]|nr:hypothetical protein [Microbacterium arborescens]
MPIRSITVVAVALVGLGIARGATAASALEPATCAHNWFMVSPSGHAVDAIASSAS